MIKVQDPSFKCINLMLGDVLALRHVERKRSVWHYMKILINYRFMWCLVIDTRVSVCDVVVLELDIVRMSLVLEIVLEKTGDPAGPTGLEI
jgi:hypothetical protein